MDYIPKKLNTIQKNNNTNNIINKSYDVNNNIEFPVLINNTNNTNNNDIQINWSNIYKNLSEDDTIIKLNKIKISKETTIPNNIQSDVETTTTTSITEKKQIASSYVDDNGWTHIVKQKGKYKEKKKKNNEDIDKLISEVITIHPK